MRWTAVWAVASAVAQTTERRVAPAAGRLMRAVEHAAEQTVASPAAQALAAAAARTVACATEQTLACAGGQTAARAREQSAARAATEILASDETLVLDATGALACATEPLVAEALPWRGAGAAGAASRWGDWRLAARGRSAPHSPAARRRRRGLRLGLIVRALLLIVLIGSASRLIAQKTPAPPTSPLLPSITVSGAPGELGLTMQILLLLTLLTLLPAVIASLTPFLRLVIVLHFLRQAVGTQTAPSNQTLLGLSLFLTIVLMQPVADQINTAAIVPLRKGEITQLEALDKAQGPIKKYLSHYVREQDLALFLEITKQPRPRNLDDVSLLVLMPAYVLSELRIGFQIGAVLFLPFLVIDLLVASITLSLGMIQLPPVMISVPFKLLLFVLVDGWNLVVGSLVKGFY
jgi:flagellar biosynthesis protein FliP